MNHTIAEIEDKPKKKSRFPLIKDDKARLRQEIDGAGGAEVLSACTLEETGEWSALRVLARGTMDEAPAVLRGLRPGDILLHNHPDGLLKPSEADLGVAYICGQSGIGFAIHDNECRKAYIVIEPFPAEKRVLLDPDETLSCLRIDGVLSQKISGYEERLGQIDLSASVVKALNASCHAILEGETGIGKSMAYLIPVILFAKKNQVRAVISTNTINLQMQLCNKDLPLVREALALDFKFCLVKGRGNYVCLRRLDELESSFDGEFLLEEHEVGEFKLLNEWARTTADGSLSDLSWVPADSFWEKVCSEKDTCLGMKCAKYTQCHFFKARRRASEADILVVNHHLLFTDLALRAQSEEYAQTRILPAYKIVVLDEAHNLEEIATTHFGFRFTGFGFQRLLGRLYHRRGRHEGGVLSTLLARLQAHCRFFSNKARESLLGDIQGKLMPQRNDLADLAREFFDAVAVFTAGEQPKREGEHRMRIGERQRDSEAFTQIADLGLRFRDQLQNVRRIANRVLRGFSEALEDQEDGLKFFEVPLAELSSIGNRFAELRAGLTLVFDKEAQDREKYVHFFAVTVRGRNRYSSFNAAPLDVAEPMRDYCFKKIPSVILVSATLSTHRSFSFIKERLGLDDVEIQPKPLEGRFPSPFDYSRQCRVFVPTDLPDPNQPDFMAATVEPVFKIAQSSGGGALVLCTSYVHLIYLYERLCTRFQDLNLECFKQGDMERHALLERFKEDGNAVLFATESFWEGVDVPGHALRNLVITKLPFAIPDDPVFSARQEIMERNGQNAFMEYQVPMAVIKLKQGFGRLIRHKQDRGTIWILDKRIVTKFYGRHFLDSLPPMRIAKGSVPAILPEAVRFFSENVLPDY